MTIPFVLILIGWPLCEYAITHQLNIPTGRLATARWVFRFSLISALWNMCATPYLGMFTAKQRIAERSAWDVVISVANFFFFYSLTRYRGDAWLLYSGGVVAISVSVGVMQMIRACRRDGNLFTGGPAALQVALARDELMYHRGSIKGAWPQVVDTSTQMPRGNHPAGGR